MLEDQKFVWFWNAKAHDELHWKLGHLNVAWVGSVIEVTEHTQKPKQG